jgi:hypothetical protein
MDIMIVLVFFGVGLGLIIFFAGVDQDTGHATDRFHTCSGGDPHPAPVEMRLGSPVLGPRPAQRRVARMGAAAGAA